MTLMSKLFGLGRIVLYLAAFLAVIPCFALNEDGPNDKFVARREDSRIPEKCRPVSVQRYAHIQKVLTVGPSTKKPAFDHVLPFTVDELRQIHTLVWRARFGQPLSAHERLQMKPAVAEMYLRVEQVWDQMGFSLEKEETDPGKTAEIIAILEFEKLYPPSDYYVTGGISYFEYQPTPAADEGAFREAGELDVVAVRKSDCQVVAIAEVKATGRGERNASLARRQLRAFRSFLYKTCHSERDPSYDPTCFFAFHLRRQTRTLMAKLASQFPSAEWGPDHDTYYDQQTGLYDDDSDLASEGPGVVGSPLTGGELCAEVVGVFEGND